MGRWRKVESISLIDNWKNHSEAAVPVKRADRSVNKQGLAIISRGHTDPTKSNVYSGTSVAASI